MRTPVVWLLAAAGEVTKPKPAGDLAGMSVKDAIRLAREMKADAQET